MLFLMVVGARPALAINGTWIDTTSGGLWSTTTNWSGGTVANGINGIADFSTLNITADDTVHLDSSRSIGQLKFGDTTPSNNWILDNNGTGSNFLSFAGSVSPQITVNNQTATLSLGLGNATVTKSGTGTLVLGGATDNTSLGMVVNAGTLVLAKSSSHSPDIHAIGGTGLTIAGGTVQLAGTGGDQIFDQAGVTINSGTFDFNGQSETFDMLSGTGGTITNSLNGTTSTMTFGAANSGGTYSGVIQNGASGLGVMAVTKTGSGVEIFSGANAYSGATTINQGTLQGGAANTFSAGSAVSVASGATFNLGGFSQSIGSLTGAGNVTTTGTTGGDTLTVGSDGTSPAAFSGVISDASGGRTLALTKVGGGTITLSGNNTFSGSVTINAGTLGIGSSGALNSTTPNAVAFGPGSTGTLALNVNNVSIGGLSGSSTSAVVFNGVSAANTLTVIESGNETFAGSLQDNNIGAGGALSLVKAGAGSLTLSGNNSFTGSVTINAGTLQIGSPGALSTILNQPNAVTDNGTLTLNGNSVTVAGLNGNGIVQNANSASATLTLGNTTNNASGTFSGALQDGSGGGKLSLVVLGNGDESGSAQTLSGNNTFTGGVTVNGGVLIISTGSLVANVAVINGGAFAQAGGSLVGNVTDSGTFLYDGGTFGGRLIVTGGMLQFISPITVANGLENDGGLTLVPSFTLSGTTFQNPPITLGGPGLDNEGTLTLAGGTLILSTSPSAANVNRGTFNLSPTVPFDLSGATLTNGGALNLNGGIVNGAGLLSNGPGGTISGTGIISSGFANAGGVLVLTNGTITISQPFTNGGLIELNGIDANLAGGAITNSGTIFGTGMISSALNNSGTLIVDAGQIYIAQASTNAGLMELTAVNSNLFGGTITNTATGTIQGIGIVGSAVTNNGTIEPLGGTLVVGGALSNSAGGLIRVATGNKLLVSAGLSANAGTINLIGGTFDNSGHPLNNTGQISGFGILATGGTGLDNNGSITFSGGLTDVNGPVTNENGKTITVAYNPAIFTGLVTNNGGGTFNVINTTVVFAGGSIGNVPGAFANAAGAAFGEAGSGVIEVDGPPSFGNSSSIAVGPSSTLRIKATSGTAAIGTGVTASVAAGGTLELAGSVSALANGANRVNIVNNSNAPGLLVTGTNQQVGNIDGSGTTQVNAGSDLTANYIIQGALVIGGTSKSPGMVTIDASDASGNPLASVAVSSTPTSTIPVGAGLIGYTTNGDPLVSTSPPLITSTAVAPVSVPEPSSLLLLIVGVLVVAQAVLRRSAILNRKNCARRA